MTKLTLTIEEIQIAYDAIDNTPQFELTKSPILAKLDVESLQETYDIDFENAEFEHMRIAVGREMLSEGNDDIVFDMINLYNKLMAHRQTLT